MKKGTYIRTKEIREKNRKATKKEYKEGKIGFKKNNQFGKNNLGRKHTDEEREKIKANHSKLFGKNAPNWKGGKMIDKNGYIYIHQPNHPFANINNYVFEHRLIAEKCLGRYLTKLEVIHHINEIIDDNRKENLYLCSSNAEHKKECHNSKNKQILKSNL